MPFFLVIDNRVSFSWMPKGTDPGMFSVNPNGSINGTTAKQVYSFTHFDAWAYGTNFFTISTFKSGHNDPASPCVAPGVTITGGLADCAGATEIYGLFRSTFGFNQIFNTKAFTMGPLQNISFEVGMDANTENNSSAPAKRDVVAGLQFAFDLPYKGYLNVAPLVYWEFSNHNAFTQCGAVPAPAFPERPASPTATSVQADMGGRDQLLHGPRLPAAEYAVLLDQRPRRLVRAEGRTPTASRAFRAGSVLTASKIEFNCEPIRLTFDAQQGLLGSEALALRRPLGRLSLLAEQVRSRPQCDGRRLHARSLTAKAPTPAPNSTVYGGVTVSSNRLAVPPGDKRWRRDVPRGAIFSSSGSG